MMSKQITSILVANRDARDRINEGENAQRMTQFIDRVLANPMLMQAVGPDQGIAMMNKVARGLGFDRDFKLVNQMNNKQMLQQNNEELMQGVQQMLEQATQQMTEQIKGIVDQVAKKNQEQDEQIKVLAGAQVKDFGFEPITGAFGGPSAPGINGTQGLPPEAMMSAMQQ